MLSTFLNRVITTAFAWRPSAITKLCSSDGHGRFTWRQSARIARQSAIKIGLVCLTILWLAVYLKYQERVGLEQREAAFTGQTLTRLFEENTLRSIGEVDKSLLYLRRVIESRFGSVDFHELVSTSDILSDIIVQTAIIDANGIMRASSASVGPAEPLDLHDRDHFKVHVGNRGDTLFISAPVLGRVSKKWSIQLTRRFLDKDGTFAGVVVASLDPLYLANSFQSVSLDSTNSISLIGLDGIVRATSDTPGQNRHHLGESIAGSRLLREAEKQPFGHYFISQSDEDRGGLISFRRIRGQPLLVAMRVAKSQIELDADIELTRNSVFGLALSILIVGTSIWAAGHQLRLRLAHINFVRSRALALRKSSSLQLTLDNMDQGIISVDKNLSVKFINQLAIDLLELDKNNLDASGSCHDRGNYLLTNKVSANLFSPEGMSSLPSSTVDEAPGNPSSFMQTRPDGSVLEFKTVTLADGGFIRTITDVTRRTRAQAEIARLSAEAGLEREHLQTAVNNMPIGLVMYDSSSSIIVCNDRYREMYRLTDCETKRGTSLIKVLRRREDLRSIEAQDQRSLIGTMIEAANINQMHTRTSQLEDGRLVSVRHHPLAVGGWVAIHEDITERRLAEQKIEHLAQHDSLTGLANRAKLHDELDRDTQALDGDEQFAVLLLDLDHFKVVNDTLGHPVGDKLLIEVGKRLVAVARSNDLVARLGGDEFAIIERKIPGAAAAGALADRLKTTVTKPYLIDGHQIVIGVSVGIACSSTDGDSAEKLLQAADIALYQAKHAGRNTHRFFKPAMSEEVQQRRNIEQELREAIVRREFEVHYQPIVNAISLQIEGYEGLVRWRHPVKGLVPPIAFIPIAESTGLIQAIGNLVMREACRQIMSVPGDHYISVNVSPIELTQTNFVELVTEALETTGLAPSRLQLEVTEGVLLKSDAAILERLRRLRTLGIGIAMDDFGTGYSSLSYLRTFPFDKIKIDRSLIKDVGASLPNMAILKAIADLANGLGMALTAEGVETAEELAAVRSVGCHQVQGYFTGRPMSADLLFSSQAA